MRAADQRWFVGKLQGRVALLELAIRNLPEFAELEARKSDIMICDITSRNTGMLSILLVNCRRNKIWCIDTLWHVVLCVVIGCWYGTLR